MNVGNSIHPLHSFLYFDGTEIISMIITEYKDITH